MKSGIILSSIIHLPLIAVWVLTIVKSTSQLSKAGNPGALEQQRLSVEHD